MMPQLNRLQRGKQNHKMKGGKNKNTPFIQLCLPSDFSFFPVFFLLFIIYKPWNEFAIACQTCIFIVEEISRTKQKCCHNLFVFSPTWLVITIAAVLLPSS